MTSRLDLRKLVIPVLNLLAHSLIFHSLAKVTLDRLMVPGSNEPRPGVCLGNIWRLHLGNES